MHKFFAIPFLGSHNCTSSEDKIIFVLICRTDRIISGSQLVHKSTENRLLSNFSLKEGAMDLSCILGLNDKRLVHISILWFSTCIHDSPPEALQSACRVSGCQNSLPSSGDWFIMAVYKKMAGIDEQFFFSSLTRFWIFSMTSCVHRDDIQWGQIFNENANLKFHKSFFLDF